MRAIIITLAIIGIVNAISGMVLSFRYMPHNNNVSLKKRRVWLLCYVVAGFICAIIALGLTFAL